MYCVVVGDIVNSKELDPDTRKDVTDALQRTFDRINTDYLGSLMTTFGMVRGDAFEGVMLAQYHAPQIVQDLIKSVYRINKTKVRISVAMGTLTVTSEDRNVVDGPAFHKAFENLEEIKKRESEHWLQVHFEIGSFAQALVNSQIALLTALTEKWTDRQRETVWAMERHGGRRKVVGRLLGITTAVVDKHLKAANYEAYRQAWEGLTDFLVSMDEYTTEGRTMVQESYVPHFNRGVYAFSNLHNRDAALLHFKKSLKLAKDELEENDPLFIPIYNKLAWSLVLTGKSQDAEKFINESLRLQETMPKTRLHYAETLFVVAELNMDKENYPVAKEFFERALDTAHAVLNNNHPFIGDIYGSLAILHKSMGEYEKALEYYETTLTIERSCIHEVPPAGYAVTLFNVANSNLMVKDYERALSCAEEALAIFEENLPPDHRYIAESELLLEDIKNRKGGDEA